VRYLFSPAGWNVSNLVTIDIYKFDPNYLENEERYKAIKAEILGEDSGSESGSEEDSSDDEEEDEGMNMNFP
jgi:hypothetical protein